MQELSGLTLGVIKLGFLAVLWLFVLTTVSVMRSDLFGTRLASRGRGGAAARPAPAPAREERPARPRRRRGAPSLLVVTEGPLAGTTVPLEDAPITLGRAAGNTIVLADEYASSHHARFFGDDGTWYVEDLGSTNGTWVERARVAEPTAVRPGVPVRVGATVVELRK
ncbi:type III secretion system (T3SS) inner membrane Yop/YscD-like protein [Motilibacter rhizosphaerae]|uniref:Type III secretion system (T3SS) inner membrane Yop/YscD-like protein n=1 Tax=Motilibacter rhizosphaerae TaxID=598652 RepID=A0A4Q7NWH1_9ACTN|nr:FHA domain-containing protein [Motilibacter rhizosphaerae]RZS91258.1 type III secretion system (T3SS) inner membrane Yop/YscD-like protein [Motilibacter rhizosphaerae]